MQSIKPRHYFKTFLKCLLNDPRRPYSNFLLDFHKIEFWIVARFGMLTQWVHDRIHLNKISFTLWYNAIFNLIFITCSFNNDMKILPFDQAEIHSIFVWIPKSKISIINGLNIVAIRNGLDMLVISLNIHVWFLDESREKMR